MPSIVKTISEFNNVYDSHKNAFDEDCTPSFQKLLWHVVIYGRYDKNLAAFCPVVSDGRLEIGIAEFYKPGYIATHVAFKLKCNEAAQVCEDLNVKVFGLTSNSASKIVSASLWYEEAGN